jgi:hypothetical protein
MVLFLLTLAQRGLQDLHALEVQVLV